MKHLIKSLFAFMGAMAVSLVAASAFADGGNRDATTNLLQFHCPADEHVLALPRCPDGQARYLERANLRTGNRTLIPSSTAVYTLSVSGAVISITTGNFPAEFQCGACLDENELEGFYSVVYRTYWEMRQNNPQEIFNADAGGGGLNLDVFFRENGSSLGAGKIIFNGKVYFNADSATNGDGRLTCLASDPGCGFPRAVDVRLFPPDRNNTDFCHDWFGGEYNISTRECECPDTHLVRSETHARCAPREAIDCALLAATHEFQPAAGGAAGGTCEIRTPRDCDVNEYFNPDDGGVGGICTPTVAGNCDTNDHFTPATSGPGGTCAPRTARNCADNYEFQGAAAPAMGGVCLICPMGGTSTGGAECACPEGQEEFEGSFAERLDDFCAAREPCAGGTVSENNECVCPTNAPLNIEGTCEAATDPDTECERNEVVNSETNRCEICGTHEIRGAEGACVCAANHEDLDTSAALNCVPVCGPNEDRIDGDCVCPNTHFGEPGACVDRTECADTHEYNFETNECEPRTAADCTSDEHFEADASAGGLCIARSAANCEENEVFEPIISGGGGGICRYRYPDDCQPNEHFRLDSSGRGGTCPLRNSGNCSIYHDFVPDSQGGGICEPRAASECGLNERFTPGPGGVGGTCDLLVASDCAVGERFDEAAGGICILRIASDCGDNEVFTSIPGGTGGICVARTANVCDDTEVFESDASGAGGSCVPNTASNCGPNEEFRPASGEGGICVSCVGGMISSEGAACECPVGEETFDGACRPVVAEDCAPKDRFVRFAGGGSCVPRVASECENGQVFEPIGASGGTCAPAPAPASSGGGGSDDGDKAAALLAVPVLLIGYVGLIQGSDYVESSYNFSYSGENESIDWGSSGGFSANYDGLRSYFTADQSNGDAVKYQSGISFERDNFALTYDAAESQSDYDYDLGARLNYEHGLWTIAPTVAAEFQYRTGEEAWDSDASMGVSAVWTAHRWLVSARSAFSGGDGGHKVDLEFHF